jgi:hypothetical protein
MRLPFRRCFIDLTDRCYRAFRSIQRELDDHDDLNKKLPRRPELRLALF